MGKPNLDDEIYEIRLTPLLIFAGIFMGLGVLIASGIVRIVEWWTR